MKTELPALTAGSAALQMRPARFEDVSEILRLIERAVVFGCREHYQPSQLAQVFGGYAQALFVELLGPYETVAAEDESRIVGFAQLDPRDGRLRALFVDAAWQRRGVGRALLGHIEVRALARGCGRLHGAMSLNAVSFYAAAGFRPCGGSSRLTSNDGEIPVVRMEKRLNA
ncbi:MAG TPA: GNAT family N-acetyltransferase [Polyangia bacterium]|jgi:GNAT superfamily N-acetyltransferase|nr:GNAT family N-acetyltransferase [Polyangia bacterium]